jgi:hypothetical protein
MSLTIANPIVITSSMATSYKTQLAAASPNAGKNNTSYGTLQTLIFEKIRWVNPGISQTLSIGDPISGAVLFLMKSNTAGEDIEIDMDANPIVVSDFEINAFPAGSTLLIYTR